MPAGRVTKGAKHAMQVVGRLTVLGAIDPQDAASLAAVLRKLEMLLQGYAAVGDGRKLKVYVAHVDDTQPED